MNDYIIKYKVYKDGTLIKEGKMRVKRKYTELQAKMSLNDYLTNKYNADSIEMDSILDFGMLNSMFGF